MNEILKKEEAQDGVVSEEVPAEDPIEISARKELRRMFNQHDPKECVSIVSEWAAPYLNSKLIDKNEVRKELRTCTSDDEQEFVDCVLSSLTPVLDLKLNHPKEFERMQREAILTKEGNNQVNELIYYGSDEDGGIHIHIAPHKHTSNKEKIKLVKEGFKELAKIVEQDEGIKEITATSWIVAEYPELLELLGFTVKGEIDESMRQDHFLDEERAVHHASMSRETLLNKYLKTE